MKSVAGQNNKGNKERILETAGNLFFENGYHATSINRIAEVAEVNAPTIYWYFKSKQDLLANVLLIAVNSMMHELNELVKVDDPVQSLRRFVCNHVTSQLNFYSKYASYGAPHGFNELYASLGEKDKINIKIQLKEYTDALKVILQTGKEQGIMNFQNITVTSRAILTM